MSAEDSFLFGDGMSYYRNTNSATKLVVLLLFIGFGFLIGAICWTYSVNTWLEYFDKDASIVWWQGGLIGFVPWVGHAGLPLAVLTWLLMLFLI